MGEARREQSATDAISVEGTAPTEIDPWAPGGSMSVDWVPGCRRASIDVPPGGAGAGSAVLDAAGVRAPTGEDAPRRPSDGDDPGETGSSVVRAPHRTPPAAGRTRRHTAAVWLVAALVAIAVVAVAVAIAVGASRQDEDRDAADGIGDAAATAPALTELGPPTAADAATEMPSGPTPTAVGPISWVRVAGDDRSLPLRVERLATGTLLGEDDTADRWTSVDGGLTWAAADRLTIEHEIGGVDWTLRLSDDETTLWQATDGGGLRRAGMVVTSDATDGYTIRTEIAATGRPIAIADDVFLPLRVSAELPWAEILGTSVGRPYRVEVDVDGGRIRAVSGDFHELPVRRLALQDVGSGRFELRDADDVAVWSFVAPGADEDLSTAHVITGLPITVWTRWDGESFRPLEPPWGPTDRVDVAATGQGVVARAVSLDRRSRLWRSTDGATWTAVTLPTEPNDATPVSLFQGDDEMVVTAFIGDRDVAWTTRDGLVFEELARVPGIDRRRRGPFGWVAPPPRSEPQFRVSADGAEWEVVDLRSMLGLDDARWDVDISVTVVGPEIFVAVDGPVGRTLLIGTVG